MMYNSILQTTNNKMTNLVEPSCRSEFFLSNDIFHPIWLRFEGARGVWGNSNNSWGINILLGGSIKNSGVSTSFSDRGVSEYGTLKAQASCTECGTHSPRGEPFTDITKWVIQSVFILPLSSDVPCIIYSSQHCL